MCPQVNSAVLHLNFNSMTLRAFREKLQDIKLLPAIVASTKLVIKAIMRNNVFILDCKDGQCWAKEQAHNVELNNLRVYSVLAVSKPYPCAMP